MAGQTTPSHTELNQIYYNQIYYTIFTAADLLHTSVRDTLHQRLWQLHTSLNAQTIENTFYRKRTHSIRTHSIGSYTPH